MLQEKFDVPYKNRFQEGEMRKRIQFMYGGKLEKMKFVYTGPNLEAVLDRLPTARVLGERVVDEQGNVVAPPQGDGVRAPQPSAALQQKEILLEAEVFSGNGLDMWLRSQGDWVKRV